MREIPFLDLSRDAAELGDELTETFARVCRSGRYILGEEVKSFEREFADYCGVRHCVGVGNGLDALRLILMGYGIGPGDEVIVPTHTFIATWLAVSAVGADIAPVEPDLHTRNIDAQTIEAALTPRTRAVIPVHLYGLPVDMEPIMDLARRRNLLVIEDAAQAHGAKLAGRRAGGLGHAAAFSFYPTKNLGALGDGGAITTDDDALADRLRALRNYGSTATYMHELRGLNSRLDELQAALLRRKLAWLDAANARRTELAEEYLRRLAGTDLELPPAPASRESSWHLFVVRHPERDRLAAGLKQAGIGTMVHYPLPPHRQNAYADAILAKGAYPVAERLAGEILSLPLNPSLTREDVAYIADTLVRLTGTKRPAPC